MFSHESGDVFSMHEVVLVLLPVKGWNKQHLISPSCTCDILLYLRIIVTQSWNFTSLPGEMTDIETVLNWNEEEQSINDERPFVNVSPHRWVRCIYHF